MNNESLIREMSRDELLKIAGTNIESGTPRHAPVRLTTQDELDAKRVDFDSLDIEIIFRILQAAARVMAGQTRVEQEQVALGKGVYGVPKLSTQPINSWGYSVIYTVHPEGGAIKGFSYGFLRGGTTAPWSRFSLSVKHPYEFVINLPVKKVFFDEIGLVYVGVQRNYRCDNAGGKCDAFFYKSIKYPGLGYTFLVDPGRADLNSGVASSFREVKIEIIKSGP